MEKFTIGVISLLILCVYIFILFNSGYVGMIVVFVVVAVIGVIGLLVTRYIAKSVQTVQLAGVGKGHALRSASHAVFAAEDHVVGFPSGSFEVEYKPTGDGLVATEFIPKGSGSIVMRFVRAPFYLGAALVAVGARSGVPGFFVGLFGAFFLVGAFLFFFVVPLTLAWLVEIALKPLVRSQIDVTATEENNVVTLTFEFRGASAFMVQRKVLAAFVPPVLPARFAGLVPGAAPQAIPAGQAAAAA